MGEHTEMNQAIAELAFAMAKIDGKLDKNERDAFFEIIKSELSEDLESAKSRFELLEEITKPKMEDAYHDAISIIRHNRHQLNEELKAKFVRVIEWVANSKDGIEAAENILIKKFKQDLKKL